MSREVDYYFSLSSPWSYLGHGEFCDVVRKHGLTVRYKPVKLSELFAQTGGLPLAKRHPARQNYRMLDLQRWREKRQVPMQMHPKFWPFDATLADCTIVALAMAGSPVERVLPRAFAGVFEENKDLCDERVLGALLTEAGVDAAETLQQAKSAATVSIYADNGHTAIGSGVFGAPSYVLDGEVFWGQDRIGFLDSALVSGRKAFRADV